MITWLGLYLLGLSALLFARCALDLRRSLSCRTLCSCLLRGGYAIAYPLTLGLMATFPGQFEPVIAENYPLSSFNGPTLFAAIAITLGWLGIETSIAAASTKLTLSFQDGDAALRRLTALLGASAIGFFTAYGFEALFLNIRFGQLGHSHLGVLARELGGTASLTMLLVILSADRGGTPKVGRPILIVPTFLIAVFFAIQGAGRLNMIELLLACVGVRVITSGRWPPVFVLAICASACLLIAGAGRSVVAVWLQAGDAVSASGTPEMSIAELLLAPFEYCSYAPIALEQIWNGLRSGHLHLRWGSDLALSVLFYGRLVGWESDYTIAYYTTDLLLGRFESFIPPGILGLGLWNFGYFGLVIVPFGLAISWIWFVRLLEHGRRSSVSVSLGVQWALLALIAVISGEPRVMALKLLCFFVTALSLCVRGVRLQQ